MSTATDNVLETENKIILTYLNGTGYIFDANDYMELRMRHRIIGATMGTSCTRGWSAEERTMPVELTPCETRLLLEQCVVVLVSKVDTLLRTPMPHELVEYKQNFETRINEQAEALKAEKLREAERNVDKILAGKRKKLLKAADKATAESDIKLSPADVLQEISDNFVFERKNALLAIDCAHAEAHTGRIVKLPADNSLKYRVFRDFWLRGKCITAGDAFGADFLIYPGDPLLYHASHIVILLSDAKLQPLDLIAKVRLSVIVNKLCVFAYFAAATNVEEEPAIHYQTVQWEGNRVNDKLKSMQDL